MGPMRKCDAAADVHEITFANGTIAIKLKENRKAASQHRWCDRKLRGMKTRRTFKYESRR